jgi:multidrug resistance efflux pump
MASTWAENFFTFWADRGVPATLSGAQVIELARAYDRQAEETSPSDDALIPLLCAFGAVCTAPARATAQDEADMPAPRGLAPAEILVTRPETAPHDAPPTELAPDRAADQQSHLLRGALARMRRERDDDGTAIPNSIDKALPGVTDARRLGTLIWQRRKTVVKSVVALLLALVLMWVPLQRLLSTTSAQAVINARIVTVRAPIAGIVSPAIAGLELGRYVASGHALLEITNPRADRAPLDQLERTRETLLTSIAVETTRRDTLVEQIAAMKTQTDRFRQGRLRKLHEQLAALDADLVSSRQSQLTAANALERARRLITSGVISRAALDAAIDTQMRARQRVAHLVARRAELGVEISYLRSGTYIGDSYNDMPASERRRLDDTMQFRQSYARLVRLRTELAQLESRILREAHRFAIQAKATVRSRTPGRIWDLLVAPGEQVAHGQDLLHLLDCSAAIVTAAVSETVYERLSIGQPAMFRPRDGGADLRGWIIGLNGLAAVGAKAAIQQTALDKEPYKVTVKFPALAASGECHVGRSGVVIFDAKAPAPASWTRAGGGR